MEITFLGMNCVRLTGRNLAVLCDPYPKSAGLGEIKSTNDVSLLTLPGTEVPAKAGIVIDGPGEYEVKGAMITGAPAKLHIDDPDAQWSAAVYSLMIDGVRVGYLGNITPELSNEQVEALGQVDVLILPVGGHGLTLDAQSAAKIISQLEPKYVVPTHYDDGTTKYEVPQDKPDNFLKEVGAANAEPISKLKVSLKDLPTETTVVLLQRQGS